MPQLPETGFLTIDPERPLAVFTSRQIDEAQRRTFNESTKKFGAYSNESMFAMWVLCNFMCELGIKTPEDFYI